MTFSMGVMKNEHGVYVVRRKVPKALERAVPAVMGNGKQRQVFLQRSLGTKDQATARRLAAPVVVEFDRIIASAEAQVTSHAVRSELNLSEIRAMADYYYATVLGNDSAGRRLSAAARKGVLKTADAPQFGLSETELERIKRSTAEELALAKQANAKGDVSFVIGEIEEVLDIFRINLPSDCAAYGTLGRALLRKHVEAMEAQALRNAGEIVETPRQADTNTREAVSDETLIAAFDGWKKHSEPSDRTAEEFERAVRLFIELHGHLPIAAITPRHATSFREALQSVPRRRSGEVRKMSLPELVRWADDHPSEPRIAGATVNKLYSGVQSVTKWGKRHGYIPVDASREDPFAGGRVRKQKSKRHPFNLDDLRRIFNSPVYRERARPVGGQGEAAYWLPLLALFTGARLAELAGLAASDVRTDPETGVTALFIAENLARGRSIKTESSERAVPVHPELVRIGFLEYVAARRAADGEEAWLYPLVAPGTNGDRAWSKWFGRYRRQLGVTSEHTVFHSFRHAFSDRVRRARVDEERKDALLGHTNASVGRSYGAQEMLDRFGWKELAEDIAGVTYPGLDLSHLKRRSSRRNLSAKRTGRISNGNTSKDRQQRT